MTSATDAAKAQTKYKDLWKQLSLSNMLHYLNKCSAA